MNSLLYKLLGIEPADWAQGGEWHLELLAAPDGDIGLMAVLGVLVLVIGIGAIYRREIRSLSRRVKITLITLRTLAVLGVVLMLLEPAIVFIKTEYVPTALPILLDTSASMGLSDAYINAGSARATADAVGIAELDKLREAKRLDLAERILGGKLVTDLAADGDRQVTVLPFSNHIDERESAGDKLAASGNHTAIGDVLGEVFTRYRGTPLAGVLLITDGQSNAGVAPDKAAMAAAANGVPVSVLTIGTPEGPQNAKVADVDSSPVVLVRDPIALAVTIESYGLEEAAASVRLERRRNGSDWELTGEEPVTLSSGNALQRVVFQDVQQRPGTLEYRAVLTVDDVHELTTTDNIGTTKVQVVRQKMRVLFVAGRTFPEVQFLRNALLRDDAIISSTWLMTAEPGYRHMGDRPIQRLPNSQEELDDYDCVVLYDPDPDNWPSGWSEMLMRFVGRGGGGLVYVAGEYKTKDCFERANGPGMEWLKLLPVVRDPGLFRSEVSVRLSSQEEWKLKITAQGANSRLFQFDDDSDRNAQILRDLPGMYWHFPVTRAKPGATVLARHGDPRMRNRHGAQVLLATQLFGPGRSYFVAFDSTYRWRYLDDDYFDLFWARMIDSAGRNKLLGGRFPFTLTTDRSRYQPMDEVTVTARFPEDDVLSSDISSLQGEFEVDSNTPEPFTLSPDAGKPGVFTGTFSATEAGNYFIRVWSGGRESIEDAGASTLQFTAELPRLETVRANADRSTGDAIAAATGGVAVTLPDVAKLVDSFSIRRVERVLQDRQEIWDAPILFSLVLLLIFIEWIIRKRVRLV